MTPRCVIGIDEVGRGSLAGPLCVGGCLMDTKAKKPFFRPLSGIRDSKKLSSKQRLTWFTILSEASARGECRWSMAFVSERVIDTRGLSFALRHAIKTVLQKLRARPKTSLVLLDGGIRAPHSFRYQKTIIKGDEKEPLIAAASIVAKVSRDAYMTRLSKRFPLYGFAAHKGYGTKKHYAALKKHGISKVHRKSFLKKFLIV
ncbi:MAG: ribonuclease HII [bacterium]|nr:ribonuclease HII [bacterium]